MSDRAVFVVAANSTASINTPFIFYRTKHHTKLVVGTGFIMDAVAYTNGAGGFRWGNQKTAEFAAGGSGGTFRCCRNTSPRTADFPQLTLSIPGAVYTIAKYAAFAGIGGTLGTIGVGFAP